MKMNYTCCYQCPNRYPACGDYCGEYAKFKILNEKEKENRKKYNTSKFDVSLNRICERKLKEACK